MVSAVIPGMTGFKGRRNMWTNTMFEALGGPF
jgi:hypothetical protein